VDISTLNQVGYGIRVGDMTVSDKIRILNDADEMIVVATLAKEEEVEAPVVEAEAVTSTEPELSVERGKKEEEGTEEKEKK